MCVAISEGELLRQNGCTVLEAFDGNDALEVRKKYSGHVDLLLTDIVMPQMGGGELADWLVTIRPVGNAKPQVGLREMLGKYAWSLISVFVNEHRRKAPTWGPLRIPECM